MSSLTCNFPFSWIYSSRACIADSLLQWASLFFCFLPASCSWLRWIYQDDWVFNPLLPRQQRPKTEICRCCRRCWKQGHLLFFFHFAVFLLGLGLLLQKQMRVIDFNFTDAQGWCLNSNFGPLLHGLSEAALSAMV